MIRAQKKLQHRLLLILVYLSCSLMNFGNAKKLKLFAQNVGLLVDTRLDPLVSPGNCTSHVHSVYGNAQFNATVHPYMFEDDDWKNSVDKENQTTSELIPNLSLYWAPSLYIWDEASQKYYLVPSFARPYYRIKINNDDDRSNVNTYPKFLRLIVGDASRKTSWELENIDRDDIRWTLTTLNRRVTNYENHGDWSYLVDNPDVANRDQVEMNLHFPDCLEVDSLGNPKTESNDFRSHAAYSLKKWDTSRQTFCPASHPYRIPRLNLEVRYKIGTIRDLLGVDVVNNVLNWRLSTGDASGAGAHADFISGWPQELMENIITNCTDSTSKDGGNAYCLLDDYELDGRLTKTIQFMKPVPDEEVKEVAVLPTGYCPTFVVPECSDDPNLRFKSKRDCNWVARNPSSRCVKVWQGRPLSEWCPVACGTCSGCRNDPNLHFKNKKRRNCNWVAQNPNKCIKLWQTRLLLEWCPVACGEC